MKTTNFLAITVFALLLSACNKSDEVKPQTENTAVQYLIFGEYHGFCQGDCTTLFKIENGELFADNTDRFYPFSEPYGTVEFQATPLSAERYAIAAELLEAIPEELLNVDQETFGCPDCADQGGLYVELKTGEEIQSWNIDTNQNSLPDYLVPFAQQIKAALGELQQ